jgi:TraM recognition site of TraD and TraG
VPALFMNAPFRRTVLPLVRDSGVRAWWATYFDTLDRRLQLEIVNPVLTKVQRFLASRVTRVIVGQPRSTFDPSAWVRSGSIVIVNTAKGSVGENTAALVGATLLNLVALAVEEQARPDAGIRRGVRLLVDEFHTMPGADYETVVGELAKYGASLVLATQSLAQLGVVDRMQDRALRAKLFSNIDGLFAFQTSAEDARYLVPELGDGVEVADLIGLPDHQCYVRINVGGEPLPTFSVRLEPPPDSDATIRAELAAISAARYGRARAAVDADIETALTRIERLRQGGGQPAAGVTETGSGVERDGATGAQIRASKKSNGPKPGKPNSKKPRSKGPRPQGQLPLPDGSVPETPDSEVDPSREESVEGDGADAAEESAA